MPVKGLVDADIRKVYPMVVSSLKEYRPRIGPQLSWPERHQRRQLANTFTQLCDLPGADVTKNTRIHNPAWMPLDGPDEEPNNDATAACLPGLPNLGNGPGLNSFASARYIYNWEGELCQGSQLCTQSVAVGCSVAIQGDQDIAYVQEDFVYRLEENPAWLPDIKECGYADQRFIVLPCHVAEPDPHYFVLIIDTLHWVVYLMDTLDGAAIPRLKWIRENCKAPMLGWIAKFAKQPPKKLVWNVIRQTPQPDVDSCGVLVIENVRRVICEPIDENSPLWDSKAYENARFRFGTDWRTGALAKGGSVKASLAKVKAGQLYTARCQLGNVSGSPLRQPEAPTITYDFDNDNHGDEFYRKFFRVPNGVVHRKGITSDNYKQRCTLRNGQYQVSTASKAKSSSGDTISLVDDVDTPVTQAANTAKKGSQTPKPKGNLSLPKPTARKTTSSPNAVVKNSAAKVNKQSAIICLDDSDDEWPEIDLNPEMHITSTPKQSQSQTSFYPTPVSSQKKNPNHGQVGSPSADKQPMSPLPAKRKHDAAEDALRETSKRRHMAEQHQVIVIED